jgi:hypothetical protein
MLPKNNFKHTFKYKYVMAKKRLATAEHIVLFILMKILSTIKVESLNNVPSKTSKFEN